MQSRARCRMEPMGGARCTVRGLSRRCFDCACRVPLRRRTIARVDGLETSHPRWLDATGMSKHRRRTRPTEGGLVEESLAVRRLEPPDLRFSSNRQPTPRLKNNIKTQGNRITTMNHKPSPGHHRSPFRASFLERSPCEVASSSTRATQHKSRSRARPPNSALAAQL